MSVPLRLDTRADWIQVPGLRGIFSALQGAGGQPMIVGGAVRDALLGRAVADVDIAVDLKPDMVAEVLRAAGLKVVLTGIEHGTVTAVVDHKGYEITTLREDVETDGRRATVAFTGDRHKDASRRDFTFNALYADLDGTVLDFFNGREDLQAGRVRFIGVAQERIKEDVLRILRFFRFYAWFGRGGGDEEGLTACGELAELLPQLSAERVWNEIRKLLSAPDPVSAWEMMHETGVLAQILPEAVGLPWLRRLVGIEKDTGGADAIRRLAMLIAGAGDLKKAAANVAQRLKMSRVDAERLETLAALQGQLHGKTDPMPLRQMLYRFGVPEVRDGLLLLAAKEPVVDLKMALLVVEEWDAPALPVLGEDVLKMGVTAGPRVGEVLRGVEAWWMEKDFRPTPEECLAEAGRLIECGVAEPTPHPTSPARGEEH